MINPLMSSNVNEPPLEGCLGRLWHHHVKVYEAGQTFRSSLTTCARALLKPEVRELAQVDAKMTQRTQRAIMRLTTLARGTVDQLAFLSLSHSPGAVCCSRGWYNKLHMGVISFFQLFLLFS